MEPASFFASPTSKTSSTPRPVPQKAGSPDMIPFWSPPFHRAAPQISFVECLESQNGGVVSAVTFNRLGDRMCCSHQRANINFLWRRKKPSDER